MTKAMNVENANSFLIEQDWGSYSSEEHEVWGMLYERRMRKLRSTASGVYLEGHDAIGLSPDAVPNLAELNSRLGPRTGWQAVAVTGFIPAHDFFAFLAQRRFPTTITVRPRQQMDYVPEPDIFHDVFGHVPLHANPVFARFLQRFGEVAARAVDEEAEKRMARLFWFTVEFGLIRERGEVKLYGSGLISSVGDAENALSDRCDRRPFSLEAVMAQPFEIDHLQDVLFVIESYEELFEAVERVA
jgi:phenylalanine-4-hydroxylase